MSQIVIIMKSLEILSDETENKPCSLNSQVS